jgi:SIR2-like protein
MADRNKVRGGKGPNIKDWVARTNSETLYHLERQGRTEPGLVPFIGAGVSLAFGLKSWRSMLLDAAPPRRRAAVLSRLNANQYEDAAQILLDHFGPDGFQNMVGASAGDHLLLGQDFTSGTVSLLPLIATGPVITTNFDRALEMAFTQNGMMFEQVISGPRPDLIVDGLHGNRRVLMKLHGDWQDRVGRTFARADYDTNYGKAQPEAKRALLEAAEELLFSSRSILFVGASLEADRPVQILQRVQMKAAGVRHFAVLSLPLKKSTGASAIVDEKYLSERERQLRGCGVLPIWYCASKPEEHAAKVAEILGSIVERVSVRIVKPSPAGAISTKPNYVRGVPLVGPPLPPELNAHLDRVTRQIESGHLTFVLGSAIHSPTRLMASSFYKELARVFECEALDSNREAVAQYISDRYGRDDLHAEIRKLLTNTPFQTRQTHEMFADWTSLESQSRRRLPPPIVITTNYDDLLEWRLREAAVPHHLFSYQAEGPDRGRFYHLPPEGDLRVVERPEKIRELSEAMIVVKLNGGLDSTGRIRESYATTRLDYWDLAARLAEVLPMAIQCRVRAQPLLFLGHGLVSPDIESLVRFAHRDHPGPRSWAVVLKKSEDIEYWKQCGVEILDHDVNVYVAALRARFVQGKQVNNPPKSRRVRKKGRPAIPVQRRVT